MAANVRIEDHAFNDMRVKRLGVIAGYNEFEALGRLAHLWRICTQRQAYSLEEFWIESCLGEKGVEALLKSGLGEAVPGGIRIKGTEGRIEWLRKLRANSQAGGEANKARHLAILLDSQPKANGEPIGSQKASHEDGQREPTGSQKASQPGARTEPEPSPSTSTSSLKSPLPPEAGEVCAVDRTKTDRLFARYWAAVPNKKAKQDAARVFRRLRPSEDLLHRILAALAIAKASPAWQKEGGAYIPHPAKWLRGGCWEDEVVDLRSLQSTIKTAPDAIINPPSVAPAFSRKAVAA